MLQSDVIGGNYSFFRRGFLSVPRLTTFLSRWRMLMDRDYECKEYFIVLAFCTIVFCLSSSQSLCLFLLPLSLSLSLLFFLFLNTRCCYERSTENGLTTYIFQWVVLTDVFSQEDHNNNMNLLCSDCCCSFNNDEEFQLFTVVNDDMIWYDMI